MCATSLSTCCVVEHTVQTNALPTRILFRAENRAFPFEPTCQPKSRRARHCSCLTVEQPRAGPCGEVIMWNWFNCRVSGRHEYGVSCERGAIFLRCVHCSRRSSGWSVDASGRTGERVPAAPEPPGARPRPGSGGSRVEFPGNGSRIELPRNGSRVELPRNRRQFAPRAAKAPVVYGPAQAARVLPFVREHQGQPDQSELRQAG
jgi:hypothetical protein